jgi:antitoxin component HigA of HigAB toxin-antitoxin module
MSALVQKKLFHDLKIVLEKYAVPEYDSKAVIEILSRSLRRKPKRAVEHVTEPLVSPGRVLHIQREQMELTLTALSKKTGIPTSNLSAMENGKRPIGLKTAKILAKALGISYKAFV